MARLQLREWGALFRFLPTGCSFSTSISQILIFYSRHSPSEGEHLQRPQRKNVFVSGWHVRFRRPRTKERDSGAAVLQ